MALNASPSNGEPGRRESARAIARPHPSDREVFSTALFTGLNVAVFLILTGCVAAAAILYSQGA